MAHKIIVTGIGPGSADFVVPAAKRKIEEAKVLVGSRRALESFAPAAAETCPIGSDIIGVLDFIERKLFETEVVVMVSGDPGFYSMLSALRRRFPAETIDVIPGISSVQLAFARVREPWQDASLISMHGREAADAVLAYSPEKKLGILTDNKNKPSVIASALIRIGWPASADVWLCENLSYANEQVLHLSLEEATEMPGFEHSVMVVKA